MPRLALILALAAAACVDVPTPIGTAGQIYACRAELTCGGELVEELARDRCGDVDDWQEVADLEAAACEERGAAACPGRFHCSITCDGTRALCTYDEVP